LIDKTKIERTFIINAVTLILNYLLIPISYYGSAIATIAAYGSMMIISYKMGKRNIQFHMISIK
jgi:O-antigen/teichoic acid export membrane protein